MLRHLTAVCVAFLWVCGFAVASPWTGRVVAHGDIDGIATESVELGFGVLEGATDAFDAKDPVYGIVDFAAPPPSPAAWGSQAPAPYFRNLSEPRSHLQLLSADIRGIPSEPTDEIAWTLVVEADGSSLPAVSGWSLTWDVSELDTSWAAVRMTNEHDGSTIDMRGTTTTTVQLGVTTTYTIRTLPATPPIFVPSVAEAGVAITVEALVYGSPDRIERARLYYARVGETRYASRVFAPDTGEVWTVRIPGSHVTTAGVVWRAVTENTATGVHRTHSTADPGYIPVAGSASLTLRPTSGDTPLWNVVAPTVWPEVPDIAGTLDGPNGGFLGGWFAWGWNAVLQRWEVAAPLGDDTPVATSGFAPGRAWFVAVAGIADETRQTPGATVDPTRAFAAPLSGGWNLLANPFPFAVAWSDEGIAVDVAGTVLALSDATAAGVTDGRLIYLDVETQTYVTRFSDDFSPYAMPPGQGWWFYADAEGATLLIAPVAAPE